MSVEREVVETTYGGLKPGDRFQQGYVVKRVLVRDGQASVVTGRKGYRGQFVSREPADKPTRVERVVKTSTAGAYVRQSTKNRETGTTVEVLDLAAPGSEFTAEPEGRYATVCADHSCIVTHPTLALATSHAANPTGWCDVCRDVYDGCTCAYSGMEIETPDPSCPVHGLTGD